MKTPPTEAVQFDPPPYSDEPPTFRTYEFHQGHWIARGTFREMFLALSHSSTLCNQTGNPTLISVTIENTLGVILPQKNPDAVNARTTL